MPKAREEAAKAQALDPGCPDAYTVTGFVQALYEWNWSGAEESFRQAIRLNGSESEARTGYAFSVLLPTHRTEEAIEELKQAVPCGVDSVIVGRAFYERRFTLAEAIRVAEN